MATNQDSAIRRPNRAMHLTRTMTRANDGKALAGHEGPGGGSGIRASPIEVRWRKLRSVDPRRADPRNLWGLEADVNNGGFDQYYFNGAGDQAFFAPEALRAIGAYRMASIVERANAIFGPDGPSRKRTPRQSQRSLAAPDDAPGPWDELDREFYDYPDDLYALLTRFIRAGAAG